MGSLWCNDYSLLGVLVVVDGNVRTAGYRPTAHRPLWGEDFLSKHILAEASNGAVVCKALVT